MRCSDGHLYVVKFKNNPQHCRVLANEQFATRLAAMVGLPVPETAIVEVEQRLIDATPELRIEMAGSAVKVVDGMQFGSRFVDARPLGVSYDYLPPHMLDAVQGINAFAGMLALDKWTGNADGRQAVFLKANHCRAFRVTFIDQGYCFNGGKWTFPDSALSGVYGECEVYHRVTGWESFEPWLTRIRKMDEETISRCAASVPAEWCGSEPSEIALLIEKLATRRMRVQGLIADFRDSSRHPFPNWRKRVFVAGLSGKDRWDRAVEFARN